MGVPRGPTGYGYNYGESKKMRIRIRGKPKNTDTDTERPPIIGVGFFGIVGCFTNPHAAAAIEV